MQAPQGRKPAAIAVSSSAKNTRWLAARSPGAASESAHGAVQACRRPWSAPWPPSRPFSATRVRLAVGGRAACRLAHTSAARSGLVVEQPRFRLDSAGEAGERAVGADHPVARDDDREGVARVGGADGGEPRSEGELAGHLPIAGGLAVGDRRDGPSQTRRSQSVLLWAKREVELRALAGEVLRELAPGGLEQRVVALHAGGRAVPAGEVQGA